MKKNKNNENLNLPHERQKKETPKKQFKFIN